MLNSDKGAVFRGLTVLKWSTTWTRKMYLPTVWAHCTKGHAIRKPRVPCAFIFFFRRRTMKKVGIIMGSDSDLPVVRKAADTLRALDIPYEAHVYSAHRTPEEASRFASQARENGFGVLIAAAGMAAHLAGAIAANTTLPVIGIPIRSAQLGGMDALLSTVQMPTGIPVATVAIDGAANAALLAAQILAVEDAALAEKLAQRRKADADKVRARDAAVEARLLADE